MDTSGENEADHHFPVKSLAVVVAMAEAPSTMIPGLFR